MTLMFYMISASIRIRAFSGWWVPTSMFGDKANHKPFPLSTFVWLKCLKNLIGLKKPWTFLSCTTEKFHMEMEPLKSHPRKKRNIIWTIHLHSKGFKIFTFPGCGQLLNMIPFSKPYERGIFILNQLEKFIYPLISCFFSSWSFSHSIVPSGSITNTI